MNPMDGSANARRELAVDIFRKTGVAVDDCDPIIVAALFFSKTMETASTDAKEKIRLAAVECIEQTQQAQAQQKIEFDRQLKKAVAELSAVAQSESKTRLISEVTKIKAHLNEYANKLTQNIRQASPQSVVAGGRIGIIAILLLCAALAGAYVGSFYYGGTRSMSADDVRAISMGCARCISLMAYNCLSSSSSLSP